MLFEVSVFVWSGNHVSEAVSSSLSFGFVFSDHSHVVVFLDHSHVKMVVDFPNTMARTY